MSSSIVTPRPPSSSNRSSGARIANDWTKNDMPGGRKLWCKLMAAFIGIFFLGASFLILGSVFIRAAMDRDIFGFIWCIIGIVSGSIMMVGSIILGRVVISNKWRYDQQPNYPSMAIPRARLVPTVSESEEWAVQIDLQQPPPYAERAPANDVSELSVPPPYSEDPITDDQTGTITANDALPQLPSYEEASRHVIISSGVDNAAFSSNEETRAQNMCDHEHENGMTEISINENVNNNTDAAEN